MPQNKRRLLAIDTSTPAQLIAYQEYDSSWKDLDFEKGECSFPEQMNHSSTLLENVRDLLLPFQANVRSLDLVVISIGPGSFTGLRIGLSVAKSLARAAQAAIVGVPTLDLFAETARRRWEEKPEFFTTFNELTVAIDARRGEVFFANYALETTKIVARQKADTQRPKRLLKEFDSLLSEDPSTPHLLVGNAHERYPEFQALPSFSAQFFAQTPPPSLSYMRLDAPDPLSLADLGRLLFLERGGDSLNTLEPNYVRPSDAKKPKKTLLD